MPDPIRCGRLAVVLLLLCSACDRASITPLPGDPRPGTTSQAAIEAVALDKPFPHYPTRSLENGAAGVAVASIMVGFDGRIERVDVLEAPDADIAEGLRDALERWVLPVHPDGPRRTGATMVFYFLIEAGEGRVVSGLSLAFERTGVLRSVAGEPRRIDEAELRLRPTALLEIGSAVVVVDTRDRELYARDHRDGAITFRLAGTAVAGGGGAPARAGRHRRLLPWSGRDVRHSRADIAACRGSGRGGLRSRLRSRLARLRLRPTSM